MKTTTFKSVILLILNKRLTRILAVFAAFFIWLSSNSISAQVTTTSKETTPNESSEPVDPIREKQKEAFFAKMQQGVNASDKQSSISSEFSAEPLPNWNDTGDFEADKAAYELAVEGWLQRNAHLYSEEEIAFLRNPILRVEDRERNLKTN